MPSQPLPPDELQALQSVLRPLAEVIRDRGLPAEAELEMLLLGVDLEGAAVLSELARWARILAGIRGVGDTGPRDMAIRTLVEVRGVAEAPARLAASVAASVPDEPEHVAPGQPIVVSADALGFGELDPGRIAQCTLQASGGPGQVAAWPEDRVVVSPTQFGPDDTLITVEVRGGLAGELLLGSLRLSDGEHEVLVDLTARWTETAQGAPQPIHRTDGKLGTAPHAPPAAAQQTAEPLILTGFRDTAARLASLGKRLGTLSPGGPARAPDDELSRAIQNMTALAAEDPDLRLVVMGEFSSGKSTLINALIGREIAKVAPTIETSHVSVFSYGDPEQARFVMRNGRSSRESVPEALKLLAEQGQHSDLLSQLAVVEFSLNAPLLLDFRLVDTPGLATVLRDHEAISQAELERSNCVLWVFDANQAGTGTEREYLAQLANRYVVGLVNKIDEVDDDDEVVEVVDAARSAAPDVLRDVLTVSAREASRAIAQGDEHRLACSGLPRVVDYLRDNVDATKRMILDTSRTTKLSAAVQILRVLIKAESTRLEVVLSNLADLDAMLLDRRRVLVDRVRLRLQQYNDEFFNERRSWCDASISRAGWRPSPDTIAESALAEPKIRRHTDDLRAEADREFREEWHQTLTHLLELAKEKAAGEATDAEQGNAAGGWQAAVEYWVSAKWGAAIGSVAGLALAALAHVAVAVVPWAAAIGAAQAVVMHKKHIDSDRAAAKQKFEHYSAEVQQRFDDLIHNEMMPAIEQGSKLACEQVRHGFCRANFGDKPLADVIAKVQALDQAGSELKQIAAAAGLSEEAVDR